MFQHPGCGPKGVDYLKDLTQKHKKAFVIWYTRFNPLLHVVHPETAKAILKTGEPKPVSFFGAYRFLVPWLGMSVKVYKCGENIRLFVQICVCLCVHVCAFLLGFFFVSACACVQLL